MSTSFHKFPRVSASSHNFTSLYSLDIIGLRIQNIIRIIRKEFTKLYKTLQDFTLLYNTLSTTKPYDTFTQLNNICLQCSLCLQHCTQHNTTVQLKLYKTRYKTLRAYTTLLHNYTRHDKTLHNVYIRQTFHSLTEEKLDKKPETLRNSAKLHNNSTTSNKNCTNLYKTLQDFTQLFKITQTCHALQKLDKNRNLTQLCKKTNFTTKSCPKLYTTWQAFTQLKNKKTLQHTTTLYKQKALTHFTTLYITILKLKQKLKKNCTQLYTTLHSRTKKTVYQTLSQKKNSTTPNKTKQLQTHTKYKNKRIPKQVYNVVHNSTQLYTYSTTLFFTKLYKLFFTNFTILYTTRHIFDVVPTSSPFYNIVHNSTQMYNARQHYTTHIQHFTPLYTTVHALYTTLQNFAKPFHKVLFLKKLYTTIQHCATIYNTWQNYTSLTNPYTTLERLADIQHFYNDYTVLQQ